MPPEKSDERRRAPRRSIFNTVQYAEMQTEGQTKARISDLSATGCYVDTLNPLPTGTQIRLRLKHSGESFDVLAEVVRSEPNMGMGVKFLELTADQKARLESWLNN